MRRFERTQISVETREFNGNALHVIFVGTHKTKIENQQSRCLIRESNNNEQTQHHLMILGGTRHERAAAAKERKEIKMETYAQVIAKQFCIVEGKIT